MKKIVNFVTPALSVAAIVFSVAAFNTTCAATHSPSSAPETAAVASMPAVQPVDLTSAADKALPSVVHIKYVQNSKIQTVEVQTDPSRISSATPSAASSAVDSAVRVAPASSRCRPLSARLPAVA